MLHFGHIAADGKPTGRSIFAKWLSLLASHTFVKTSFVLYCVIWVRPMWSRVNSNVGYLVWSHGK